MPDGSENQIPICADESVPVCAPQLLDRAIEFEAATLLSDQTWHQDWAIWSEATATPTSDPKRGPQFSLYSLAVEEAKAGAGLLIGHLSLIEEALADGALQRASDQTCETGRYLCVQRPDDARRRPETDQIVSLLC